MALGKLVERSKLVGCPFIRSFLLSLHFSNEDDDLMRIIQYQNIVFEYMKFSKENTLKHTLYCENSGFGRYYFINGRVEPFC